MSSSAPMAATSEGVTMARKKRDMTNSSSKAAKTRIKVKIYLGGPKGAELSIVRQVQKGGLQGAGGSTGESAQHPAARDVVFGAAARMAMSGVVHGENGA